VHISGKQQQQPQQKKAKQNKNKGQYLLWGVKPDEPSEYLTYKKYTIQSLLISVSASRTKMSILEKHTRGVTPYYTRHLR